jgi:hypothetical protein
MYKRDRKVDPSVAIIFLMVIFFITQKPKIKEQFKENYSMLVSILVAAINAYPQN